jgi:hypothetical protein
MLGGRWIIAGVGVEKNKRNLTRIRTSNLAVLGSHLDEAFSYCLSSTPVQYSSGMRTNETPRRPAGTSHRRLRLNLHSSCGQVIIFHSKTIFYDEGKIAMPNIIDEIKRSLDNYNGKWNEKKGLWDYSTILAERKAFLSKKKLTYSLRIRIDEGAKAVKFSEMLLEAGSGLSSGGDFEGGMSTGFGVKTESYNTFGGARKGTIEEQSSLFGKDYSYQFDFKTIRVKVEEVVKKAGYKFEYQILPVK